jgi:hypothetical protein
MIKYINSGSPHITVSNSQNPIPISPGAQSAGMVRYNPNMQQLEVYDGIAWHGLNTQATIDLGWDSRQAIEWAHKKMHQERKLQELMDQHPGLKDLHDKFEMMRVLCQEEEKHE